MERAGRCGQPAGRPSVSIGRLWFRLHAVKPAGTLAGSIIIADPTVSASSYSAPQLDRCLGIERQVNAEERWLAPARYSKGPRTPVRASSLDEEPETEPDMPIYPLEFCKRFEENWKRRAGETGSTSRTPQTVKNQSVVGLAPRDDGDAILSRWPWLLAIGQGLQSEYAALKQPVEKRLVALLKRLRRS